MIFYLGNRVDAIDEKLRIVKNKNKSWEYGYNKTIDTVIISRDGTLGEVYNICGLNIGLPQQPDKKKIKNYDNISKNQKWEREKLPSEINKDNYDAIQYDNYITKQNEYRLNGFWVFINGYPIYLTGTYWFFLQWIRIEEEYPNLRIIQNELMIFWEACKADSRSLGMIYVKNRRIGASSLAVAELLESGTIYRDKHLGLISKTGDDASDIFDRIVTAFKRLAPFFIPKTDGTNTPKKVLSFQEPTKRRKVGQHIEDEGGLNTTIKWYNTVKNAMDGKRVFRSLIDEAGKFPPDVPVDKYWDIVKTSHLKGRVLFGKSMVVSTVNRLKDGGREYKRIWDKSDINKRDDNGRTLSGLYRIFIPAEFCLEGFFDEYGFSIVDNPAKPVIADDGQLMKIGAKTYLRNIEKSLENDPEGKNEQLRQFPHTESDAFRPDAVDSFFNVEHIIEQLNYNRDVLEDTEYGNNEVERGNLHWKNGIQDTEVVWSPDPVNGRFWIAKDCHPPIEIRNKKKLVIRHDIEAYAPFNGDLGCFGIDPFNRSKTVDGRGSQGAIHLQTKYNPYFPNNAFILEYLDKPKKVEYFFEDVIMVAVYFSMPFLPESSNDNFLRYIKERKYRWFVLNDPNKKWKEMSQHEKEFGGINPQGQKVRDLQFYALHSYIEDYIGIARTNDNRPKGEIGFMPFSRTIEQWKDVDPDKRTEYDAYISSTLALIGNRRKVKVETEEKQTIQRIPFKLYNISGTVSKAV